MVRPGSRRLKYPENRPNFRYNASFTTKRAGYYRPFFLVYCFLNQA